MFSQNLSSSHTGLDHIPSPWVCRLAGLSNTSPTDERSGWRKSSRWATGSTLVIEAVTDPWNPRPKPEKVLPSPETSLWRPHCQKQSLRTTYVSNNVPLSSSKAVNKRMANQNKKKSNNFFGPNKMFGIRWCPAPWTRYEKGRSLWTTQGS